MGFFSSLLFLFDINILKTSIVLIFKTLCLEINDGFTELFL